MLAALVAFVVIPWFNRGGDPEAPSVARDYNGLLTMLPKSVRTTCIQVDPVVGSSAQASCAGAVFQLWNSSSAMTSHLRPGPAVNGDCSMPPTALTYNPLTYQGRVGNISCNVTTPGGDASQRHYRVEWSVDKIRLTGAFTSPPGQGDVGYESARLRAFQVLVDLP